MCCSLVFFPYETTDLENKIYDKAVVLSYTVAAHKVDIPEQ